MSKTKREGYGGGLYKQTVGNSTSWLLRYHVDGKERHLGLGSTKLFSLKEARKRATLAKAKVVDGRDPVAEKRQAKAEAKRLRLLEESTTLTFEAAAKEYYRQNVDRWTNDKVRAQFPASMKRYVYPKIGRIRVADVQFAEVLRCLSPIWKDMPETAGRVRRRLEDVLGWAKVHGYRTAENCALWEGCLEHALPPLNRQHESHEALPFDEMSDFWQKLSERQGQPAAALRFTILTAARGGEVRGMKWSEIDFDAKTWTVPAERIKMGKEHVVPLSDAALAILEVQKKQKVSDYVFYSYGNKKLSENSLMQLLRKQMGYSCKVHGFRSTFRDWAGERTNFPHEIIEFALAHRIPDKTVEAYRRYRGLEKRRKLMDQWARFVTTPAKQADVVPIRAA